MKKAYGSSFPAEQEDISRPTEAKRKPGRGSDSERTSFLAIITLMLSLTVFFLVDGSDRTEGIAWGNLVENGKILPASGFVVMDMSDLLSDGSSESDLSEEEGAEDVPMEADDILSAWRAPSRNRNYEWQWPDRVVMRAESEGVAAQPADDSRTSRLDGFKIVVPDPLPKGMTFAGTPGNQILPVEDLRFSSFISALPLPKEFSNETLAKSAPKIVPLPGQPAIPANKAAMSYDSVVLSVFESGASLPDDGAADTPDPEEEIVLTEVKPQWREHVVKQGETLSTIAALYSVSIADIMKANELKNANRLAQKQLLLVPNDGASVDATLEEVLTRKGRVLAAKETVTPVQVTKYTVAKGDTLWSIARAENLEIDTLYGSNNLKNPDMLKPGLVLRIPDQDGMFYVVRSGDTLATIAKRYGITADMIRKANAPEATKTLAKGAEIFLPGARPEAVQEAAPKKPAGTGSSSRTTTVASTSGASRSYKWPVIGKINSPFGWRRHPVTRRRDFHTGVDIKAPRGRSIKAAKGGRVEYSGWMGGYGRVVVIKHNDGNSTLYAHCNALSVRKGQTVAQGQQVGTVGTSGRTTGPHLHFEVRQGKGPVNPLKLLR